MSESVTDQECQPHFSIILSPLPLRTFFVPKNVRQQLTSKRCPRKSNTLTPLLKPLESHRGMERKIHIIQQQLHTSVDLNNISSTKNESITFTFMCCDRISVHACRAIYMRSGDPMSVQNMLISRARALAHIG